MASKQDFLNDAWLHDPVLMRFADLPNVEFKKFFGGVAVYQQRAEGKVMLVFTGGTAALGLNLHKPQWRGLFVATEFAYHTELIARCPALVPHSVLKKWLFIPDEHPDYTATLQEIYRLAQHADYRLGVMSQPKKLAKKSQQRPRLACRKSQRKV